jgi:hypothetical protein
VGLRARRHRELISGDRQRRLCRPYRGALCRCKCRQVGLLLKSGRGDRSGFLGLGLRGSFCRFRHGHENSHFCGYNRPALARRQDHND